MAFVSLYRVLKTSLLSLWRNRWLSLAAVLIMVLTLFTITFFASMLIFTNRATESVKSKVDIIVYFNESVSKDQIFAVQNTLLSRSDIKNVEYISKEQALERWRKQNNDNEKIRDVITDAFNPLPRSLEIKADRAERLETIYQFLNTQDYVPLIKEISYHKNKELIDRLVSITTFVKYAGWVLSGVFVLISILIIYNTVRLTIFARSGEIEIMKLVGASDLHVQGPFFIEGITYGFLGAIISSFLAFLALRLIIPPAERYIGMTYTNLISAGVSFWLIIISQLILGIILGTFCSVFAVRKYLRK